jgi:hypothetical protein
MTRSLWFALLVGMLLVLANCGGGGSNALLGLKIVWGCDPALLTETNKVDTYCINVLYGDETESGEMCSKGGADAVQWKVEPTDEKVVVEVKGYNQSTLILKGRSAPVMLSTEDTYKENKVSIPLAIWKEFLLVSGSVAGCEALPFSVWNHTATVFPSGHVLVIGSGSLNAPAATAAFLMDTVQNTVFQPISTPNDGDVWRHDHAASLLSDGRVVILGGMHTNNAVVTPDFEKSILIVRNGQLFMSGFDISNPYESLLRFEKGPGPLMFERKNLNAAVFLGNQIFINNGINQPEIFVGTGESGQPQENSQLPTFSGAAPNPNPFLQGSPAAVVPVGDRTGVVYVGNSAGTSGMGGTLTFQNKPAVVSYTPYTSFAPNSMPAIRNPTGVFIPSPTEVGSLAVVFMGLADDGNGARPSIVVFEKNGELLSNTVVASIPSNFPSRGYTATWIREKATNQTVTDFVFITGGIVAGQTAGTNATFRIQKSQTGWTVFEGPRMRVNRSGHTASLLPDGRLLIVGGLTTLGGGEGPVSAEVIVF